MIERYTSRFILKSDRKVLSEIKFTERVLALKQEKKTRKDILPFVTTYEPSVPNFKHVLMKKWHNIQCTELTKRSANISHRWRLRGLAALAITYCRIYQIPIFKEGWRSGESARLPPMCPVLASQTRRHMWVEFVAGSLLCSERFFSGYSGFPLSSKTNISKFQFDPGMHEHF